jgi:tight adherence protein C
VTAFALLGALLGCGLAAVVAGLRRERRSLRDVVAALDTNGVSLVPDDGPAARSREPARSWLGRVGMALDELAGRTGHPFVRPADLAVLARDEATQAASLGLAAVGLAAGAVAAAAAVAAVGLRLPAYSFPVAAVLGAVTGTALVVSDSRRQADRERETFIRALGCWLELVALAQAGGMGVESALQVSSEISDDPCFVRMRAALAQAQVAATAPWEALGALGRELGVRQLEELAGTLALAGTEGARVRATLVAKAASIRQHQLSRAEAEANATSERLFLPSIVLMLAFMVFLMYPAGVRLAHVF